MKISSVVILSLMLTGCQTLQVVDAEARPVEGAKVTVFRRSLTGEAVGTTDARGRIRIDGGLADGEQIEAVQGNRRGSVRGDADPLLIILRPEAEVAPQAAGTEESTAEHAKDEQPNAAEPLDPAVKILGAELTGGRNFGLGTNLVVRTDGGVDLDLPAGERHRWDQVLWKEGTPFVHVIRGVGDEDGFNPQDIYRFDLPTLGLGWRERIVLRRTEVEERFGRGSWIKQLDTVSSDGRLLLIEVGRMGPWVTGKGSHIDYRIYIFDTETREYRLPVE